MKADMNSVYWYWFETGITLHFWFRKQASIKLGQDNVLISKWSEIHCFSNFIFWLNNYLVIIGYPTLFVFETLSNYVTMFIWKLWFCLYFLHANIKTAYQYTQLVNQLLRLCSFDRWYPILVVPNFHDLETIKTLPTHFSLFMSLNTDKN